MGSHRVKSDREARYHTDEGLAATDLRGELPGMPARIDITTDDDLMIVNAEGNVDMVALYEWTGQSLLTQLSGVSAYQASVYVPLLEGEQVARKMRSILKRHRTHRA